ncbi:probable LRR receptor-like serine/threonine-protein kinase At3g47570, partial [Telopea speciosissima]|uniref:probable LRR receptor-like serine/threonine-protein kinase At3g47570 n=1 Tax=Telopea speciosissima TaxID=54955 RepID=UPI001CC65025
MGQIPPSFDGNLSSLYTLDAGNNGFSGSIPNSLGQIKRIVNLRLGVNKLSGTIPSAIYNLSSLRDFVVQENQLQGSLPPNLGFSLPNLRKLSIGRNQFHGPLPISISNLSNLVQLYAHNNNFTGKVAIHFGGLSKLTVLTLVYNHLGSGEADDLSFMNTLTNCSSLARLWLAVNQFGGVLPNSIANLSTQLREISIRHNRIYGNISPGIGNLVSLSVLSLTDNLLEGSIPTSIGRLQMLVILYLAGNKFTGPIPSLGNLTILNELRLENNHLHGKIPSSLGRCEKLLRLHLSGNSFNGIIPKEIFDIFTLFELKLSRNDFFGSLPSEVGRLTNLEILDVSENMLSGEIPSTFGTCISLEQLFMEGNLFQGSIPLALSSLRGLQDLDLSCNNFSGFIPIYLGTFRVLQNLNLSFNHLEGEVPTEGVFGNLSVVSLIGNNELCGGIPELHLQACHTNKSKEHGRPNVFKLIATICGCGVFLCLIFMTFFFIIYQRRKERKESITFLIGDHHCKIFYAQLLKATNGFSSTNLVGVGSFGSVYRGVLNHGETIVAVKVLNIEQSGASKSFMAECKALRNIRHRNLVKILTSCSSIDFEGNDFMALVYEFMPGGNLEDWLHPHANSVQDEERHLNLIQRLNIAIDIATALDYLHHHCHVEIIHCDLKPSNILLDDHLTAHLGDFGISRILSKATGRSQNQISSIEIKGSIGYIAPEYGAGADVSTHGDVYSYGIFLLEMFTGKRPTNEMFKDNFYLHSWAKMALHDGVMAIIHQSLLPMENDEEELETTKGNITGSQRCMKDRVRECLNSVIKIGVICSAESPWDRMNMNDVLKKLNLSKNYFFGFLPSEVGQLTKLEILDVSENMLSGEIPHTLGACTSLQHLYMKRNLFQGSIPFSLSSLRGLEDLDLSHNNFSGFIPKYFETFKFFQNLNLSFNLLEGEVPTEGVFGNLSAISVIQNNKLCGGIPELHLSTCQAQKSKEDGKPRLFKLIVIICGCGASLCLIFMICFFIICRKRKERKEPTTCFIEDRHFMISYAQLLKATDGFSSANLIGVGSFGSVYKGVLNHGELIVAVKVLNVEHRSASKSFMAECEAFRNIRHRNLVKILTSCSSVDFEGNDFMALVYEFMPSGNLEGWLHPHANGVQDEQRHLDLVQRLNIAIDIATALDHLHNYCHMQIIHCDLKPSNILLDDDLTAHLGDFGISRILSKGTGRTQNQTSSIGLKGSIGYIPPEYGAGVDVSTHGDVYSYGIFLLEMFTGKRPTDEMFKDNFYLHSWAKMALHDGVMAIIHQSLLPMENDEEELETTKGNITGSQRCTKD